MWAAIAGGLLWWLVGFYGSAIFMRRFLCRVYRGMTVPPLSSADLTTASFLGLGGPFTVIMWWLLDVGDRRNA